MRYLNAGAMLLGSALTMAALAAEPPAGSPKADKPDAPKAPEQSPQASKPGAADSKPLAAKELLAASAKKYAAMKSYRDTGNVHTEMIVTGMPTTKSDAPFSTAFERDGRFLWEFRHSATPGAKPDQQYVVWSKDQKAFHTFWTLQKQKSEQESMSMAMAGPTGISGGSATVIVPLLEPKVEIAYRTTDVADPVDKGLEVIDGKSCRRIEGKHKAYSGTDDVTLWIDADMLIRKVFESRTIDPAKLPAAPGRSMPKTPAFKVNATITIQPTAEPKIEDSAFEPPAAAK